MLDPTLDFNQRINIVMSRVEKVIALLRKFKNVLPRHSLLTI